MRGAWVALLGCALLFAATACRAGEGGAATTGAFADLEPGGRGTALAGAYAALVDEAAAVHWNPARLLFASRPAISTTYADLFGLGLVRHVAAFVVLPLRAHPVTWEEGALHRRLGDVQAAVGIGVQSTQVDLDPETYAEYDLALAYARRGWGALDWGATAHLLLAHSDLSEVSASGAACDLALGHAIGSHLYGTCVLHSLFSSVGWQGGTQVSLRPTAVAGVNARVRSDLDFPVALTYDIERAALSQAALGAEWRLVGGALSLRAGMRWRDDGAAAEWRGAAGLGLHWKEVSFDYGLAVGPDELGDTHRFGLHFGI